ncbi:hypothetical protein EFA69_17410 [Rufibacter immobilis]|uniref:Uncharacterized protein n=1 Tax=Rufibacter immobilis TaxID=1348778 RepID=A0A3M9MQT9_9BACT|nr:hypothetical protein [Rufibacter immobilis]RNI27871.1 hypothetical protein EFA69_17410 [Rufibacter immobilis]
MNSLDILFEFEMQIQMIISPFLEKYGFNLNEHNFKNEDFGSSHFKFKKNNQYIFISLNMLPQDSDIGIQTRLWTEEYYSTSLSSIIKFKSATSSHKVYHPSDKTIESNLIDIRCDLELHLIDYLNGELETYLIVANLTKGKE